MIGFVVFAFVGSASGNHETVYPQEIFPTEARASGVGLCAAFSRVGAAVETFLLPMTLQHVGLGGTMLIGAAVLIIGVLVPVFWAPETRNLTLAEGSGFVKLGA